jgi:hypothetical protein
VFRRRRLAAYIVKQNRDGLGGYDLTGQFGPADTTW